MKATTLTYVGRVCATHPGLNGRRYQSSSTCPLCVTERQKKKRQDPTWRRRDLAKQRARYREPQAKERAKDYQLRRKYHISLKQFHDLLASQNGRCAICGTDTPRGKGWHVDHNHVTGAVRAVLCHHCNCLVGHAHESTEVLRSACAYLDRHLGAAIKLIRGR